MNSRRRAELQRKLSLSAVPRPPADLAERIKRDIPEDLRVETGAPQRSWGFALKIAASLVLLAGAAGLTFFLMPGGAPEVRVATAPAAPRVAVPAVAREAEALPEVSTASSAGIERAKRGAAAIGTADADTSGAPVLTASAEVPAEAARSVESPAAEGSIASAAEPAAVADFSAAEAPAAARDLGVAAAAPAPPPPSYAAAEGAPAAEAQRKARAAAPMTVQAAAPPPQPRSAFGVSVDDAAFDRVRSALEAGTSPSPASIDVEALVNYFAGAPAHAPREALRLDVEASPSPVPIGPDRVMLRVTLDAGRSGARDAAVDVEIGPAVTRVRRIGGGRQFSREATVNPGSSVTVLYELTLSRGLAAAQQVATVHLGYTDGNGERHVTERTVAARDLVRTWPAASRRHRLATLGAVWSESLRNGSMRAAVAEQAEELAAQDPEDARARDLADVATAGLK